MSFRLVPKLVTLNDFERRNGRYFALFQRIPVASEAHCVKVHVRYLISWWVLVYSRPNVSLDGVRPNSTNRRDLPLTDTLASRYHHILLACWQKKPEWGQEGLKQQKSLEGLPEEAAAQDEEEEEEEEEE